MARVRVPLQNHPNDCRTSKNPRGIGLAIFRLLFGLIGSLESPPSNLWKATRKPDQLVLLEIHE